MAAIPTFGLGRNLTSVVVTGQNVAADGTLSDGATVATLTTYLTGYDYTITNEKEEISAVTARRQNNVPVSSGTAMTLEGLIKSGSDAASAINTIRLIMLNFDYAKVVITQFSQVFTYYGMVESFNESVKDKGRIPWRLELAMVDPNVANPTSA